MVLIIFLTACTGFIYKKPNSFYNHEKHVNILFKNNKDCFYCHSLPKLENFDLSKIDLKNIGPELKIEGNCHVCHRNPDTKIKEAPSDCATCHQNMKEVLPENHLNNWLKTHSVEAATKNDCKTCHSEWYCIKCHNNNYAVENFRHPVAYRIYHSTEAFIDPASCGACHRVGFCVDCHSGKIK